MDRIDEVRAAVGCGDVEGAIALLDGLICDAVLQQRGAAVCRQAGVGVGLDELYVMRGRLLWRLNRRGAAVTDYEHALALNPGSPARVLLDNAREVEDFFNPDMLNP